MYSNVVFHAEIDDQAVDLVVRNEAGSHLDVQVKTITGRNCTYKYESKFSEVLWICLVVLTEGNQPTLNLSSDRG